MNLPSIHVNQTSEKSLQLLNPILTPFKITSNVPYNSNANNTTVQPVATTLVALVNEYMLTLFKIPSFHIHLTDASESRDISKPNVEGDCRKEHNQLIYFQNVNPAYNFKNSKTGDDYNSDFIFKTVKYWVSSYQLPTWITFPSMRGFHFAANTVLFYFPLTKSKSPYILNFYSLIPSWLLAFLPLMRFTQHNMSIWHVQSSLTRERCVLQPLWFNLHSNLFGQEANQDYLVILVSARSSPLSSPCQCGEDPFCSFNVFIQEDSFKRKVLAQDQSKVITKDLQSWSFTTTHA